MAIRPLTLLFCLLGCYEASATAIVRRQDTSATHNNFACKSPNQSNPVVVLHGILANAYTDINALYDYLGTQGFCTFSVTYGAVLPGLLPVEFGGIESIDKSSADVAAFIQQVLANTGAAKVDLVGHSEGGLMSLYVPKFYPDIQPKIDKVIAIGPPTHGTTISGLYDIAYIFGDLSRKLIGDLFEAIGCGACDDLGPDGPAVVALNNGPIAQPGIQYTIIASQNDEIVTPPSTAFVHEDGVTNLFIQQYCPADAVGHFAQAFDSNIQQVVRNALNGKVAGPASCSATPDPTVALINPTTLGQESDLTLFQALAQAVGNIIGTLGPVKRKADLALE